MGNSIQPMDNRAVGKKLEACKHLAFIYWG